MISDPYFYLCAIPAVLIFGVAKGGFGGAIGVVSVPLMALAVSPPQAAAILLPILCVMDILAIYKFWGKWDKENLRIMLPAAVIGVGIGALAFSHLSEGHIRMLIGLLALGFACFHWWGRHSSKKHGPDRLKGSLWSVLAGFTSFGIHAGGPPVSIYLMPQKLHPTLFVGTCTLIFAVTNYIKLLPYYWLGQLNTENLWTSLLLLPLAPIGVATGYFMHRRIAAASFYGIVNLFLLVTGAKLLYDGARMIESTGFL